MISLIGNYAIKSLVRQNNPATKYGYILIHATTDLRLEEIDMSSAALIIPSRKKIPPSPLVASQFDIIGSDPTPTLVIVGKNFYIATNDSLSLTYSKNLPDTNLYNHLSIRLGTHSYVVRDSFYKFIGIIS